MRIVVDGDVAYVDFKIGKATPEAIAAAIADVKQRGSISHVEVYEIDIVYMQRWHSTWRVRDGIRIRP